MIFFVIILIAFACVGCGANLETLLINNISEIQTNVLVGSCNGIVATLVTGVREEDYVKNGVSTKSVPFAVLTIASEEKENMEVGNFELIIEEEKYQGELLKNPYTGEYQVDLGDVECKSSAVVSIIINGKTLDVAMFSITEELEFSGLDALRIVGERCDEKIKEYKSGGELQAEVYVRLLGNLKRNSDNLSWGVSFIGKDGSRINYVISAYTGAILVG